MKKYTHTLMHINYIVNPTGGVSILRTICPARFITNQFDSVSLYDHFFNDKMEEKRDFFKFAKKVREYEPEVDISVWMDEETRKAYLEHLKKKKERFIKTEEESSFG
jgi:hypothetical protein